MKDTIYRNTIISHPDGNCTLGEIQKDVNAWKEMIGNGTFGFTAKTVQALINKIIALKLQLAYKECDATEGDIY